MPFGGGCGATGRGCAIDDCPAGTGRSVGTGESSTPVEGSLVLGGIGAFAAGAERGGGEPTSRGGGEPG
jgi:hypothetical protein